MSVTKNGKRYLSDKGVHTKTGKAYSDWFAILDAAGAREMTHQEIAAILRSRYRLGRWWEQKLTIMYEHERGRRQKHETQAGYQISVSRTLSFPVRKLFQMWYDKKVRRKWLLEDALVIRTTIVDKTLRGSWANGKSRVVVGFFPKGPSKCLIVVEHTELGGSAEASQMKKYWAQALDCLKNALGI
jgi:hypothetical protein